MPTFSAPCPHCGTTIYTTIGGQAWLTCPFCAWYGLLNVTQVGATGTTPPATSPVSQYLQQVSAQVSAQQQPSFAEQSRDALRVQAERLAAEVCGQMRTLTDADWRLTLPQVYERMQRAHDDLYTALGGSRMGDYHPQSVPIQRALRTLLLWQMVALHAAEQVEW